MVLGFHCWGPGSIPGRGTESPQAKTQNKTKTKPLVLESRTGLVWEVQHPKYFERSGASKHTPRRHCLQNMALRPD